MVMAARVSLSSSMTTMRFGFRVGSALF